MLQADNFSGFKPNKAELKLQYEKYLPHFNVLCDRLLEAISVSLQFLPSKPSYRKRVKSFESYYRKLLKFPPDKERNELPVLTDIIGVRIVCSFLNDLKTVENTLKNAFRL